MRSGRLIALYDRVWLRQLVPPNQSGNRFRMFEDIPTFWDAWDLEATHLEKTWDAGAASDRPQSGAKDGAGRIDATPRPLSRPGPIIPSASISILESGPLRVALRLEFSLSYRSRLVEVISLTNVAPRRVIGRAEGRRRSSSVGIGGRAWGRLPSCPLVRSR